MADMLLFNLLSDNTMIYLLISIILYSISVKLRSFGLNTRNLNNEDNKNSSHTNNFFESKIQGLKYLNYLIEHLQKTVVSNIKEEFNDHPLKTLKEENKLINGVLPNFTIIYATQSNTAKRFAEKIQKDAEFLQIKTKIKNISDFSIDEDLNSSLFLVFFISTYGEGGPSDDAIEFNRMIDDKILFENLRNENLHFAVFGLGSTKYEFYNQMAKKIDRHFLKRKLTRTCDVGLGDDSQNINKDFDEWRKIFWNQSYKKFIEKKEEIINLVEKMNLSKLYEKNEDEFIIMSNKSTDEKAKNYNIEIKIEDYDYATKRYLQAVDCEIKEVKELRKENVNGSTLLIKYSCENLSYKVGDNIGIYPINNENTVNDIISKLNFDPEEKFEVKKSKNEILKKKIDFPNKLSIKEILTNLIDLSAQVNKEILEKLKKFCIDEDQLEIIEKTLFKEAKLNEFLEKNYNICDLLNQYDSIKIDFIELYNLMPKILPRFYTVASSPNKEANQFEILISLVSWNGPNKETRTGLASSYYQSIHNIYKLKNSLNEKFFTKIIIRDSLFRLPNSPDVPLILCATGTGIAPYIGFLQEFEYKKKIGEALNKVVLFFGTKNKNYDFIYEEDISRWMNEGIIDKLFLAFSRDQENKLYVQNLLNKHFEEIKNNFEHANIYVCGGVSMGQSVHIELENLLKKDSIKKLENESRYIKEFWGK